MGRRSQGEDNGKPGAAAFRVFYPNAAAVLLDDATRDVEAQAGTVRPPVCSADQANVRVEDRIEPIGRDAGTLVSYPDRGLIAFSNEENGDGPTRRILNRVEQDIGEYLRDAIAVKRRDDRRFRCMEFDAVPVTRRARRLHLLADNRSQVMEGRVHLEVSARKAG